MAGNLIIGLVHMFVPDIIYYREGGDGGIETLHTHSTPVQTR